MIAEILKIFRLRCSYNDDGLRIIAEGQWWTVSKEIFDLMEEHESIPYEVFIKYEARNHWAVNMRLPKACKAALGRYLYRKTLRKYRKYIKP